MKKKIFSLLVLLVAAVSGAWAQDTYKIDAVHTVTAYGQSQSQDLSIADAASLPFTKKLRELSPNGSVWEENGCGPTNITVSGDNIVKGTDANWDTEITINGAGTAVVSYNIHSTEYMVNVATDSLTFTVTKNEAPAVTANYYLVGTMNDWGASKQFLLTQNPDNTAKYMITLNLQASAEFKVIALNGMLTQLGGIFTVKQLASTTLEGSKLTLNFEDATELVAGTPYLVKVSKNVDFATLPAAIQLAGVTVNPFHDAVISKELNTVETAYVDFVPTLGKTTIEGVDAKNVLFLAAENKLKNPSAIPAYMKGFRAYFVLTGANAAREFVLDLGDETTGIADVRGQKEDARGDYYDLQGRRVNGAAQKGVYIVNGKKTVIK